MNVLIHGARGSHPTSGSEFLKYGGCTPCIEVVQENERIILDAGTGLLKININDHPEKVIHIFLTHLHMDHIQGLGFFQPFFDPQKEVHVWGPVSSNISLRDRINRFLSPPFFPLPLRDISCKLVFHELAHHSFELGKFRITTEFVSHPGPTLGYRIQAGDKVMTYLPDHEPIIGRSNFYAGEAWLSGFNLSIESDLLIHDAQYTPEEYLQKIGWGHSSIENAIQFAKQNKVKKLVLFHHDPDHGDVFLEKMYTDFVENQSLDFSVALGCPGTLYPL